MSEYMSDRMPENMPDRMSDRVPEYMSDRSKNICQIECQIERQIECQKNVRIHVRQIVRIHGIHVQIYVLTCQQVWTTRSKTILWFRPVSDLFQTGERQCCFGSRQPIECSRNSRLQFPQGALPQIVPAGGTVMHDRVTSRFLYAYSVSRKNSANRAFGELRFRGLSRLKIKHISSADVGKLNGLKATSR